MQFILDRGIEDVTIVTGDIHTFFAGNVTTTGRIGGRVAATEFVGGSISSLGVPEQFGIPPQLRDPASLFTERLDTQNPHIKLTNHSERGYGVLECRPDELRCTFRGPPTALQRTDRVQTLAEMRVARGRPDVEVVRGLPSPLGLLTP